MESRGIERGDKRLSWGPVLLTEQQSGNPVASIPQASGARAETAAASPSFALGGRELADAMAPHWQCSTERVQVCDVLPFLNVTADLNVE